MGSISQWTARTAFALPQRRPSICRWERKLKLWVFLILAGHLPFCGKRWCVLSGCFLFRNRNLFQAIFLMAGWMLPWFEFNLAYSDLEPIMMAMCWSCRPARGIISLESTGSKLLCGVSYQVVCLP